jgi:L-asparagine transporter-like permease
MQTDQNLFEINHHTLKLIVGLIALCLPFLAYILSLPQNINSISESYHQDGWARNIFVGFLFAIAAFLMAYNGYRQSKFIFSEMVLSKIAGVMAVLVALFPCGCGGYTEIVPMVHYIAAAILFAILAIFCLFFYKRAKAKGHPQAQIRAVIYAVCGILMLLSILALAIDFTIGLNWDQLVFYAESVALVAFGIAWLTASRNLPIITSKAERLSVFSSQPTSQP